MIELYNRYGDKNYLDQVDEHIYILRLDPKSESYCRVGLREGTVWEDKEYDFVVRAYESKEMYDEAKKLAIDSDVVIIGSTTDELIEERLKQIVIYKNETGP